MDKDGNIHARFARVLEVFKYCSWSASCQSSHELLLPSLEASSCGAQPVVWRAIGTDDGHSPGGSGIIC